jgi:PAS domain-containing protein
MPITPERARLEAQLAELTDFLENAVVGLHRIDADGIVSWANRAELELLGYSPASKAAKRCATSMSRCAARTARPRTW